jgi:hypothetical protein
MAIAGGTTPAYHLNYNGHKVLIGMKTTRPWSLCDEPLEACKKLTDGKESIVAGPDVAQVVELMKLPPPLAAEISAESDLSKSEEDVT